MDYFGINTADDLPKIREVLADQIVEPTVINPEHSEADQEQTTAAETTPEAELSVAESGELIVNKNPEEEEG